MDCIFCKIVNKEIPSYAVYEDDDFLAILDAFPVAYGHTIIISKKHAEDIFALDENLASKVLPLAQKVAAKLKAYLNFDGLNLMQNNAESAGQSVFHFHMHLIPRYEGDGVELGVNSKNTSADELKKLHEKILKA
ncbi:MAG: HIT family protein [Clostridiales bacterium]|jgi:histidine triad (HIT) family protein|nr:HIT family protein [Clostridiales bacterium]